MSNFSTFQLVFEEAEKAFHEQTYLPDFKNYLESLIIRLPPPATGYILRDIHRPIDNGVHSDAKLFFFTCKQILARVYNLNPKDEVAVQAMYRTFYDEYLTAHQGSVIFNLTWGKGFSSVPYKRGSAQQHVREEHHTDI